MPAAEVTLPEFYSATETYYVDPVTGAPLSVTRNTSDVLKDSSGTTRLVLLKGDFKSSAASVTSLVNKDNHYRSEISLATTIVPVVAVLLGIILLVIGLVLGLMRPEDEEYEDEDERVASSV